MKHQALFSSKDKSKKKKIKVLAAAILLGSLTLLHSERPKMHKILAFLIAVGLRVNLPYNNTEDYLKLRTEKNNYFFFLFQVLEIKMWIKNHCSKF